MTEEQIRATLAEDPSLLHVVGQHDEQAPVPEPTKRLPSIGRMPIEMLGQVELQVEVVLGRARLRLQELLDVRPGQSLELDRARNGPVDVLVNGTLFARGDVVVIDDTNLGVRVSEIIGVDLGNEAP